MKNGKLVGADFNPRFQTETVYWDTLNKREKMKPDVVAFHFSFFIFHFSLKFRS